MRRSSNKMGIQIKTQKLFIHSKSTSQESAYLYNNNTHERCGLPSKSDTPRLISHQPDPEFEEAYTLPSTIGVCWC
jgi:hypothetical protein